MAVRSAQSDVAGQKSQFLYPNAKTEDRFSTCVAVKTMNPPSQRKSIPTVDIRLI